MEITKQFISAESLKIDSYMLASKVVDDRFDPDYMVAIWRGGAPIGCYVHEFLKAVGMSCDHIAIRTSRYRGIDDTFEEILVHNLGYLVERLTKTSKVLLVDDVYDSGLSMKAVIDALHERLGDNCPTDIRIATVYYKPTRNKTNVSPSYYMHESNEWLVFPHELEGLTMAEMTNHVNFKIAWMIENFKKDYKSGYKLDYYYGNNP